MRQITFILLLAALTFTVNAQQEFAGRYADTASISDTTHSKSYVFNHTSLPNCAWYIVRVDSLSGYPKWKAYFYHGFDTDFTLPAIDSLSYSGGEDTVFTFEDIGMWQYHKILINPIDSTQKVRINGKQGVYKYDGSPP
jgi:hypothetical protein